MVRTVRPLLDGWTVRPVAGPVPAAIHAAGPVPATVPGSVHTDLLAAGLIPDPYLDNNETLLAWVGHADWRYESVLAWAGDGAERAELVFEGLDTVAEIEVNGVVLARTANMHRTFRFDVTSHLHEGDNAVAVTFQSGVREADRRSLELGARPHVNHHPYNAIRKMACSFGWDWGPDTATAGIWRPVALESWSTARLSTVRPVVTMDGARGQVAVHVDLARTDGAGALTVAVEVAGRRESADVPAGATSVVVAVTVDDVDLWWPRGYGGQPLYDVTVELSAQTPLDTWGGHVGFRTITLDSPTDEAGRGFTFVVNGRPIFVKGFNWIPDDAFPHRVTRERYAQRLDQAEECGTNLLRIWGGGTFESDDFYAECDARGIFVWQDFLFACAAYSEEEPMRSEVAAEARDNVTRLMVHPSLALWCGNNENIWGFVDWGWESRLDGKSWGIGYYTELLPAIVQELDPQRAYVPGSPWSFSMDIHPDDEANGSMHIWEVWNRDDYLTYRNYKPRFVSEFGWQGPPTWTTLRRSVSDDPLTPESPGMLVHQKAMEGNHKLAGGLVPHLPIPDVMEDWHWAMQLNQARAIRIGIEYFRSLAPHCMGSIVWQLNDCWPVTSWAAIDGDGRRKPLFYSIRQAYADRLVTVQPDGAGLRVALVNDVDSEWQGMLVVTRRAFDGTELACHQVPVTVPPRATCSWPIPADVSTAGDAAGELLVAEADGIRGLWFFAEDRDSSLLAPALRVVATPTPTGCRVEVTAESLMRDVALLVDKVHPDAVVDDMLVTLLAGESAVFDVRCAADVDPQAFTDPRVVRCANELLAPATHPAPAPVLA